MHWPSSGKLAGGWFMTGWGIGLTWFYQWGDGRSTVDVAPNGARKERSFSWSES